jgi:kinetochor protein Mis14/NSL1
METEHRKIELQSPADLHHLRTQIRTAAQRKLDLHLPPTPSSSEPDDLRTKTAAHLDAFVAQVLDGMARNVSVNGVDVAPDDASVLGAGPDTAIEEYEDLDHQLREKLRTTIARRDALIGKIAMHRRGTAAAASRRFIEGFVADGEAMEGVRMEAERRALEAGKYEGLLAGVGLKRQTDVEATWERALHDLSTLNTGLAETRARVERAGEVVNYLEGDKKKNGS